MAVQRPQAKGATEFISSWGWSDELQSWSWPGSEGKPLAVRLYTPGDRVELLLNGRKIAEATLKPADKMRAELKVAYAPGTLEAVAYAGQRRIGRQRLVTAGPAAQLRLRPERLKSGKTRQDLSYVALDVLDAEGRLVPDAKQNVRLSIDGPADLAGFGNGGPFAVGSFQSGETQTFHGRALAILRSRDMAGSVRVTVRSEGLRAGSATIRLG
jgi:beta-galactosidase